MKSNPLTEELARLLADGDWHAGPELADRLGVTRARVSQQVAELRRLGLEVFSVSGRGYRLREPLTLLQADSIRAELAPSRNELLESLEVLAAVDSTNARLMHADGSATRACFAEHQSAGRGRNQRAWASPFAANLYFSVAHVMLSPRAPLGALSLAIGVALVERLRALNADAGLKWPNDIHVGAEKLAGILIEHRGEAGGRSRVVVGVGLNFSMSPEQAETIDQPWVGLADCVAHPPDRNVLGGRLLDGVLEALVQFPEDGFEPFRARWRRLDVAQDQAVVVDDGRRRRTGTARGIGADGALQVEFEYGIESVYAGDVSLRVMTETAT